jgi:hypothetical protein
LMEIESRPVIPFPRISCALTATGRWFHAEEAP